MHLVEISSKSTKNMGYAQVTQSPDLGSCASSAIVWKQVFTETDMKCNVVIEINIGPWNKVQV